MPTLPASLQPPPYRTPLFNTQGELVEEWRRFFLSVQTAILALLAFTGRIGSGQGMMGLEDAGSEDFGLVPGPKGDPGPVGIPGPWLGGGADGGDGAQDEWLMMPGSVGAVGASGPMGAWLACEDAFGASEDAVVWGGLPVALAGAPLFLPGSVIFAAASGALVQNNANLFWDNTNARLGIGTTAPISPLEVTGGGTNSNIKASSFEIQGFALNNAWLSENIYYDGTNFRYRATGFGNLSYFFNGTYRVYTAPSGTAGAVATVTNRVAVFNDGGVDIGPGNNSPGPSRLELIGGTAIMASDWALTSGWGANATISAASGRDSGGTVTVTTSALDTPGANPVITLTFKDGAWPAVPNAAASMSDNGTGPLAPAACRPTTTTLILTYVGTPTALLSKTYIFNYLVFG